MKNPHRLPTISLLALCLCLLPGCSRAAQPAPEKAAPPPAAAQPEMRDPNKRYWDVEIAPGVYLPVVYWTDYHEPPPNAFSHLLTPLLIRKSDQLDWGTLETTYRRQKIVWRHNSMPECLREYEGKLYLITFDRETRGINDVFFRYYRQEGAVFREIKPQEFPKAVAGKNLRIYSRFLGGMSADDIVDMVKIERDQDPDNVRFTRTQTAYIWNELATGQTYEVARSKTVISADFLRRYISENKPIKLTFERRLNEPLTEEDKRYAPK